MGKTGPFVKHTLILHLAPEGASLCGFVSEDLVTWGMLSWPPAAKAILSGLGRQPSVSPIDRNAIRPAPLTDSERFTSAIKLCSNVGVPLEDFSVL
jgi:hypothetical protein